ncbi:hypothetical protein ACFT54_10300 [Streptomyces cinereoruber]|uniref:hypothetical protein n=1 Tax=Streptomyces cinereoruber TaxID=67260 RepID=UPI0036388B08
MLEHYLSFGGVEIANSARLEAYLGSVGSPLDSVGVCACPTFDSSLAGDPAPYESPELDPAPWYDEDVPESADFTGLMILNVEGLGDRPVTRTVTRSAAGGAALGPARAQPRTITVTALVLAASCCGAEYGLHWLGEALSGCGGGCEGDCLTLFNCCPSEADAADPVLFTAKHRRTLRRVALIDGPTVLARHGNGCTSGGACGASGADVMTVEFVLTAAVPWKWTDPRPVLDVPVPTDDGTECIEWCVHRNPLEPYDPVCAELGDTCPPGAVSVELGEGGCAPDAVVWPDRDELNLPCDKTCRLKVCPDESLMCSDPTCRTPTPPVAPPPETCFCNAVAVNEEWHELDLTAWPRWFGSAPVITVQAGSQDLRRVTITLYERTAAHEGLTCEQIAELERCNAHSVYEISYVPAGGTLTLDGQIGRAMVECGGVCETSTDAYGAGGGPVAFPMLDCDRYCVEIAADAIFTPAADARVTIALSGREY